ncbi:BCCT transporter [Staphylococcus casei]|uniref:BCCT family transporter n=1 Tax=Staphylococcus casei TaxID=201828 RepID=UPI000CD0319F|nr:BCCT family transporter [Staphylococcus casei]PNZ60361.1 BCCT transporter [Staphylococcus casei]WJE87720.1 BCCT family transporter [Staphylococcus casei]
MKDSYWKDKLDWPVFLISGGILVLFVIMSSLFTKVTSNFVHKGFELSITYFGAFWQVLLLATFAVGLFLAFSKYGRVRLGNVSEPEMGYFRWAAIVITSGLGAGAIFWAAAEPMYYFMDVPPTMDSSIQDKSTAAIPAAMAQSFTSWGFTAWAVYGAVSGIIIMYAHYNKGMKMRPRTLLYPVFGKKIENNKTGSIIDVFCILGAVAGTIGTIGFFGFQFSYWLHSIFGIPDSLITQVLSVGGLMIIVTISATTGIDKGIQFLSKLNVWLALAVAVFILLIGPGRFIIDTFLNSYGVYLTHFLEISTFRGDDKWAGSWMLFFFGWFIGYGPLMGMLVARVSRGRTIREIFLLVSIVAAVVSHLWFSILGGSGLFYETKNSGAISGPLSDNGLPAAVISIATNLPLGTMLVVALLLLTLIFVITTADTMSYSISMSVTGEGDPPKVIRLFWVVIMAVISIILINIGEGSIDAIQSFIIVTAVPISIIMLPVVWTAPKIAHELAVKQNIVEDKSKEKVE